MLNIGGRCSLTGFVCGLLCLLIPVFSLPLITSIITLYCSFLICSLSNRGVFLEIAIRAWLLGVIFSIGSAVFVSDNNWYIFGGYLAVLAIFHWTEYIVTSVTNPRNLSLKSYLLDHSPEYHIAAVASWTEFAIEFLLFPGIKNTKWLSILGFLVVIFGECFRKLAMFHCGANFNHHIRQVRDENHILVTGGVYNLCRHPSYVGWFYWSIGTQILLCNPICTIIYTIVSWKFFKERIEAEEWTLIDFFEDDYINYQKKVPTGLPYINGFTEKDCKWSHR